jgi:cellulose synthase/poly-beta-1,6-N-acetylglucosamine synthase-like glycosyltransferase
MIDHIVLTVWLLLLKLLYTGCVLLLFFYGIHSLALSFIYIKKRRQYQNRKPVSPPAEWPIVTVQLPIYNERYLVERLLASVANLDYPRDCLQIQVLDDSNDLTTDLLLPLVEKYRKAGINIQYRHRSSRWGFKAGNLTSGMADATGELIAIFDADFVPSRDWLKKVVPYFQDERVGFVQTRWGHLNARYNLLSRMVGLGLDGHFVIEQTARYWGGLVFAFNGSAGIWRRKCIESSGGWQTDTLTEDLDLSYRAWMKGWRAVLAADVVTPAEVPTQMNGFNIQQYRWAKGSMQNTRKLARAFWKSSFPLGARLAGVLHLSMYMPFLVSVLTLLLVLPVGLVDPHFFVYFPWMIIPSFAPPLMYGLARTSRLPHVWQRLLLTPVVVLMGIGISLNCSLGVISGMLFDGGIFEATPKLDSLTNEVVRKKSVRLPVIVWGELAMGVYLLTSVYVLWPTIGQVLAPWLLTSAAGFFLVSGYRLIQYWRRPRHPARQPGARHARVLTQ